MLDGALGFGHFATIIIAAGTAQVVGPLQFAAIGAFPIGPGFERMVGPALVTPRFGNF